MHLIENQKKSLISPNSTGKNTEIVKPDVMTRVQTPVPPLCMCEFMMTLSSRLSTQKKIRKRTTSLKENLQ